MKKNYSQHNLVVLALVERGDWCEGYRLKGVPFRGQFIGSEADTRLYELFDKCVTDQSLKETTREIDKIFYTIQTKKDGNRRVYKAWVSGKRPRYRYTEVIQPDGSVAWKEELITV